MAVITGKRHVFDVDARLRRADGTHRWFKLRSIPVRAPLGGDHALVRNGHRHHRSLSRRAKRCAEATKSWRLSSSSARANERSSSGSFMNRRKWRLSVS